MSKLDAFLLTKGFNTTGAPVFKAPLPVGVNVDTAAIYSRVVRLSNIGSVALFLKATGGTTSTLTIQATNDPQGLIGWTSMTYREAGTVPYIATAITLVPAVPRSIYLDPADAPVWIRANITASDTAIDITGTTEL